MYTPNFLFRMWQKATSASLASLDKPKVLQLLRASLAAGTSGPGFVGYPGVDCRRLRWRWCLASGTSSSRHRAQSRFATK